MTPQQQPKPIWDNIAWRCRQMCGHMGIFERVPERYYGQLRTVIYTDGSALGGVKPAGSSAVVTSGDPGNPTFLDVRHQCGPEYTTSLVGAMAGT
jgi:hypothetical protein